MEMDNLGPEDSKKRPASIHPCKAGSHDVTEPAERDTTRDIGGERHESPLETESPSDSLLGE
jgi:hypothetical protein